MLPCRQRQMLAIQKALIVKDGHIVSSNIFSGAFLLPFDQLLSTSSESLGTAVEGAPLDKCTRFGSSSRVSSQVL